jgi:hypothetical protein
MLKVISFMVAIVALVSSTLAAQAANSLKKQISGRSFCYSDGQKVTFNSDGTFFNIRGVTGTWSVSKDGRSIIYYMHRGSVTNPTTIDSSGILTEINGFDGKTYTANPC